MAIEQEPDSDVFVGEGSPEIPPVAASPSIDELSSSEIVETGPDIFDAMRVLNESTLIPEKSGLVTMEKKDRDIWKVSVDPQLVKDCEVWDRLWFEGPDGFGKNVSKDFPYVMAPESCDEVFIQAEELIKLMQANNLQVEPWDAKGGGVPYTMKLLHRVNVPDTYMPIFENTDRIADHLSAIRRSVSVRFGGTGSAIAEKSFLKRFHDRYGRSDVTLVTTDKSASSIAAAAVNLSVWNETLPENEKYEIIIVNGKIPETYYSQSRTIILQIADLEQAMEWENEIGNKYDALGLDNITPYLRNELNMKIIRTILNKKGENGLYITMLGLDAGIKVSINKVFQYGQILKSRFADLLTSYKKTSLVEGRRLHQGYWHQYEWDKLSDGSIEIHKVKSFGSAKLYRWIGNLLFSRNRERMNKVTEAINKATSLSSAKDVVVTPPYFTEVELLKHLRESNLQNYVIESALYPEDFGFTLVDEENYVYEKEGKTFNYQEVMDLCRDVDPVVLRGTAVLVK